MRVVGVSRDSPYSHIEWAKRLGLNFPLLSDWNGEAVRAIRRRAGDGRPARYAVRSCFLIDA